MTLKLTSELPDRCDVLVVGAGAAGLMAALSARSAFDRSGAVGEPHGPHVVLVNNEPRIGLKILVSGGGRCNVTNEHVDERDYITDAAHLLRGLIRAFPSASARAFFESRGCPMYAEPLGKLFPCSDKARDVLDVLLNEVERAGITLVAPAEVTAIQPGSPWKVTFGNGSTCEAARVVLASGGKSLPKTGSYGFGFDQLALLGHTVEQPLPALTPVLLKEEGPLHGLAGLTIPAVLSLVPKDTSIEQAAGSKFRPLARAAGSLLVTHGGVSGPAALDVSGVCAREMSQGNAVSLRGDFWSLTREGSPWSDYLGLAKPPGACLSAALAPRPATYEEFRTQAESVIESAEYSVGRALGAHMPRSLLDSLLRAGGIDPSRLVRQLDAGAWKHVHRALTQCELGLAGTDGFNKAEVTVGGVRLSELDRVTLESKQHTGLYVCGEVVNVTGRLGGFNFQWAWTSGYAAGKGAAR